MTLTHTGGLLINLFTISAQFSVTVIGQSSVIAYIVLTSGMDVVDRLNCDVKSR